MVTPSPADDKDLGRLLQGLQRHEAPAIPVERLLRRLVWRRVRVAALGFAGLALAVAAHLLFREQVQEPPVNLQLRVVDIGEAVEIPSRDPPELNLP